jgi:hypothetical protein
MTLTRSRSLRLSAVAAVGAAAVALTAATLNAAAPAPIPAAELPLQKADPALYALARQYFPSDDIDPPQKRIFRLTRTQIDESVKALLPKHYKTSVTTVMARDPLQTNYEYAEVLGINSSNHPPLTKWIGEIAERVRKSPRDLINCQTVKPTDPAVGECLEAEARRFVLKAFRGDVAPAQGRCVLHIAREGHRLRAGNGRSGRNRAQFAGLLVPEGDRRQPPRPRRARPGAAIAVVHAR